MNLRNLLTLTVRVVDFNLVAKQPELVAKLRKLTVVPWSGLNYELDWMLVAAKEEFVNCKIILAHRFGNLVGWGLLSKEDTDFVFSDEGDTFKKEDGYLFQVFVDPKFRRQGIGAEIYKKAQSLAGDDAICIAPWDDISYKYFSKCWDANQRMLNTWE